MSRAPVKTLAKLALGNLRRSKRRTGLLLAILAAGGAGLILVGGFLDDLMVHMREDFIHTQNGHIQISRPGFVEEGVSSPLDFLIDDFASLEKLVSAEAHVSHVVPRLKLRGMAGAGGSSVAVQLIGVNPAAERHMGGYRHAGNTSTSLHITEGRNLDPGDRHAALGGGGLLKSLTVPVGSSLNFLTVREAGAIDGRDFDVVGSFQTFMKAFDERTVVVPLEAAQALLGRPDSVNSVLLLLDRSDRTDRVAARIQSLLKERRLPLEAIPWHRQADYYHQCRTFLDKIFAAVIVLMAAIFLFTVFNVMTLVLRERTREFGTMMALGNQRNTIFGVILMETIFLGILSAALALALGYLLSQVVSSVGIPMPPPPQGTAGYKAVIAISWPLLAKAGALTFLSPILGALIPAFQCIRIPIVRALSYV